MSSVLRFGLASLMLAAIIIFYAPTPLLTGQNALIEGQVLSVIEGDRLEVLVNNTDIIDVRLAGIDAPGITHQLCYADEARAFVVENILGRSVYLRALTTTGPDPASYTLYLDSLAAQDFNATLVNQGRAITLTKRYNQMQINARSQQRGLWGSCFMFNPPVVIQSVEYEGEDQVVTLRNGSNEHVNISSWRLASSPWEVESEWCYFPEISLAPNARVRIHYGTAATAPTADDFICSDVNIWRAAGDSAWLFNETGQIVFLYEYYGGYRESQ